MAGAHGPRSGRLVTETIDYDGGPPVTAYIPPAPPEMIVFAGDGQLRDAGADLVMTERTGSHGDAFWKREFPLMVAWASGR